MTHNKTSSSPLKVFIQLVTQDGNEINLGYNETTDLYEFHLAGFPNMLISMPLIEFSKLAYQMKFSYLNDDGSNEPLFLNKQAMLDELSSNGTLCEIVDLKASEILAYFPEEEYLYRKSDSTPISTEELPDGDFLIAPFIPDYLLNGSID